jgi:adenosylmethionine-8-amino-7-oxononanoate aminotransferase
MKHLFPLRTNSNITNHKRIQKTTKFGYIVDGEELIDLTCNLSTTIIGFDRHDLIDHVSNKLKESLLCPCEIEMDNNEIEKLSNTVYEHTGAHSIFTLSGSDCIETAIKCVQLYHSGQKTKIVSFENSYHGSNHLNYKLSNRTDDSTFILLPNTNFYNNIKQFEETTLIELERLFESGDISCIVQETSCWMADFITPSFNYWYRLRNLCNEYDVLLVIDDIAIGGGKTGKLFGFDIPPDIFCVGKAFSGGYFPLSVCGINKKVYNKIKDKPLTHSYTHSFHMPGIIAANYYHTIIEEEKLFDGVPGIIEKAKELCSRLPIDSWRNFGTMFHIKFKQPLDMKMVDSVFQKNGLNKGFIMGEPFTEKIVWCVPIVADDDYFRAVEERIVKSLNEMT